MHTAYCALQCALCVCMHTVHCSVHYVCVCILTNAQRAEKSKFYGVDILYYVLWRRRFVCRFLCADLSKIESLKNRRFFVKIDILQEQQM